MSVRRALSRSVLIVVVIVVIILIGVGAYVAVSTSSSSTTSLTSSSTSTLSSSASSSSSSQSASTSSSQSSTSPTSNGTLVIDVSTDKGAPGDPMTVQFGPDTGTVQTEVYEGLVAQAFNGSIVPDLAVNWTVNSPTDYLFNLRQGVLFQDNTQFNASAVVFSFDRILNNTASVRYGSISDIANITATSNYQVEIKLHNASSDFLDNLALGVGIVSPTAVAKDGSQFGSQYAVGTGPYNFVQWVQNDHITLQANPLYWGPKPTIQTIRINIVPDPTVRALQLQNGQAQLVELNAQEAQSLSSQKGIQVLVGKPNEFITVSIDIDPNYTITPLLNPLVRQAINYAINRSAIVQYIELGYAQPAVGPIPPAVQDAWNPNLQIYPFNGNITMAKQLLTEAGYPNGFSVSILTGSFTTDYLQVTEAVAADLQQAGINATINSQSFSTAAGLLLDGNGTWSLGFHDWGGTGTLSANGIMGEFYNQNDIGYFQWNLQHIRDSNLTAMLNQLSQANESQIMPLSNAIQTRILQQAYGAILYYPDVLEGATSNVMNYNIHPNPFYGYVIYDPILGANVQLTNQGSSSVSVPLFGLLAVEATFSTTLALIFVSVMAAMSRKLSPSLSRRLL
jgi:ABC-type transport system substrate-binding protein